MKTGNVIEFRHYQKRRDQKKKSSLSRELEKAIKNLIKQLRDRGPLKKSG